MLALLLRLIAFYFLLSESTSSRDGVLASSALALSFAFLREYSRGVRAPAGEYVGIDEGGPSRAGVFLFAGFESLYYLSIYISLGAYFVVFFILWVLPLGMLWLEGSLFFYRTRLKFTEAGVQLSRFSLDQLFAWDALVVTYGGTHVTLVAGDQRTRVRLGTAQTARFIEDYTSYDVTRESCNDGLDN